MAAKVVYIAGPMSGIEDFNYPAFHKAAKELREQGLTVINPAEVCPETGKDWAFYMRADLTEMLKAEGVYLLAGWQKSRGAQLERHVALSLGMQVVYQ